MALTTLSPNNMTTVSLLNPSPTRTEKPQDLEEELAITTVQQTFRTHQAQKEQRCLQAAVRIQQAYRYHRALNKRIHLQAITIIQNAFRYYSAHTSLNQLSQTTQQSRRSVPSLPRSKQSSEQIAANNALNEKLKKFYICINDTIETVADKLFEIVPSEIELADLPSAIFANSFNRYIRKLLKAIQHKYPLFVFSPYDKILKAIVEDDEHVLNNDSLFAMLRQAGLDEDQEKVTACYDLAFRMRHPHIFSPSSKSISPKNYCLNFLWVNLNPQDRIINEAQNIFGDGLNRFENADCIKDPDAMHKLEAIEQVLQSDSALKNWKAIKKSFTYRLSKWADKNPNASINLWYDSALVTQKGKEKTVEMLEGIGKSRTVNLRLRDVRQIPTVQGEIALSLHPGTQLYSRIDLLKILVAQHMMTAKEEPAQYCAGIDIDVEPMSSEELFDGRTERFLLHNGYVFNGLGYGDFENSFFIFNKTNDNLRQEHRNIIDNTKSLITELRQYPQGTPFRSEYILDAQSVFWHYNAFLKDMGEDDRPTKRIKNPRKIVKAPMSQFNLGGTFDKSAFQAESWRFIGSDNIPYVCNGRSGSQYETQILSLKNWRAEPLEPLET